MLRRACRRLHAFSASLVACSGGTHERRREDEARADRSGSTTSADAARSDGRPQRRSNDDSGAFDAGPASERRRRLPKGGHVDAVDATRGSARQDVLHRTARGGRSSKIVEMMIASQRRQRRSRRVGRDPEHARRASLNLKGLVVESPRGTLDRLGDGRDRLRPPARRLLRRRRLADHDGEPRPPDATLVATWNAPDVLKNDGDTVDVTAGATRRSTRSPTRVHDLDAGPLDLASPPTARGAIARSGRAGACRSTSGTRRLRGHARSGQHRRRVLLEARFER